MSKSDENDLVGHKFGKLTVVRKTTRQDRHVWLWRCACGKSSHKCACEKSSHK